MRDLHARSAGNQFAYQHDSVRIPVWRGKRAPRQTGRTTPSLASDSGAAAVEFALVATIFITLIFGAMQYGWFFFQRQQVEFAAREGARQVAVGQAEADCEALASLIKAKVSAPANQVTVTISYVPSDDDPDRMITVGDQGTVTVSAPIQLDLGLPLGTSTASTTATTRIEKPLATNVGCTQ